LKQRFFVPAMTVVCQELESSMTRDPLSLTQFVHSYHVASDYDSYRSLTLSFPVPFASFLLGIAANVI